MRISDWSSDVFSSDLRLGIGRIEQDAGRRLPCRGQVVAEVPVAERRRIVLRIEDSEPRGRHWVGQVAGHRRSIAGKDEPLISAVLLVVIEPQARLDADAVADLPTELADQREAGVLQLLGVDRGQPIRSEELRVGNEGVRTWRSRWRPN